MASLKTLTVAGVAEAATVPANPTDLARFQDLPMLAALPAITLSDGTLTGTGEAGQYFCDGKVVWFCYAPNLWGWAFLVNNALPPT